MQLPHITNENYHLFKEKNLATIKQLRTLSINKLQKITQDIFQNTQHTTEFMQVFQSLPQLTIKINLFHLENSSNEEEENWIECEKQSNGNDIYQVNSNEELKVDITIIGGSNSTREEKIFAPRYHKTKTISWWLVLGDADGELLAMKRVGNITSSSITHSLLFTVPEIPYDDNFLVFLIPDCVYGIEALGRFQLSIHN